MASGERIQPEKLLAHAAGLRRLARALTQEPELADDAVQQTLIAALQRPPDASLPLGPWLARVARNWIANARRTRQRRPGIEAKAAREHSLPSTQDLVIRAELHRELVAAVLVLDEHQRDAILLRYLEGLAPREIAQRLGVPLRTVNTRLARGLVRLRHELDRQGGRERWFGAFLLLPRTPISSVPLGVFGMKVKALVALVIIGLALLGGRALVQPEAATPLQLGIENAPVLDGPHSISDQTAGNARTQATAPPSNAGEPSIDPERALGIEVVTTDGTPIRDASVVVVHPAARQLPGLLEDGRHLDQIVARARTDAGGRCAFQLDPGRLYDVTASAAGFARMSSRSLYAGEQLRMLLPRGVQLAGTVVSAADGTPVAGAHVQARIGVIASQADDGFATWTDSSGHFEFAELPDAFVRLDVEAEGFPNFYETFGDLREGELREVQVELATGVSVHGRVTDGATELPLPGATVELVSSRSVNRTTTDAEGRYTLHGAVAGESIRLTARASGYGAFQVTAAGIAKGAVVQDIFLLPGRRAKGRVMDTAGRPVAGARLVASASEWVQGMHQSEQIRAQSDAEGQFELHGLRVDLRHTLLVHAAGLATAVRDFPEREWESMQIDLGDIVLGSPAAIAGVVSDSSGKAVEGRWVLLDGEPRERDAWIPATNAAVGYKRGEGFGFGRILARTDARGRYFFGDLPGGNYRLWAGDKGFARGAQLDLEVQEGEQLLDVHLELDTEPSIRGVVLDPGGQPLADVAVQAYPTSFEGLARTPVTYALTAKDGTFALCGLEATTYDLECDPAFLMRSRTSRLAELMVPGVPAGARQVRITMQRALETSFSVLAPDGQPLQGAVVLVQSSFLDDVWKVLGSTDSDGRIVLWLPESRTSKLRVAPPNGSRFGEYVAVLDGNGKFDPSFEVEVPTLRAGSSDLVVRFERLP